MNTARAEPATQFFNRRDAEVIDFTALRAFLSPARGGALAEVETVFTLSRRFQFLSDAGRREKKLKSLRLGVSALEFLLQKQEMKR